MSRNQAMTKRDTGAMSFQDVNALRQLFDPQRYNLLAPIVHMPGGLPQGTRLVVSELRIDPDPKNRQVFQLPGGNVLPGKVALDRIAAAAGISWLEERRQDDRRHPHYVEMFVRGRVRDFDGTVREITGHKALDLREDAGGGYPGKDYDEIITKARIGNRDPSKQIMEARKFIQEIAVSKACNRAIAKALGIKRGYTREELAKPFVVPKLAMDPQNESVRNAVVADMLGETAVRAMFGASPRAKKVVDAEIEEITAPVDSPSSGAGGGKSATDASPVADSTMPPMCAEVEPRKPTRLEWQRRLGAAWRKASGAGMKPDEWGQFLRVNSGKANESSLTFADLDLIDSAVDAFVESANS